LRWAEAHYRPAAYPGQRWPIGGHGPDGPMDLTAET